MSTLWSSTCSQSNFPFYTTMVGLLFIPTKSKKNSKRNWTCCTAANTVCTKLLFSTFLPLDFFDGLHPLDLCSMWQVWNNTWYIMVAYCFSIDLVGVLVFWLVFVKLFLVLATCGRWEMIRDFCHGGILSPHGSLKLSLLFSIMIYPIYHNII